jgi:hypothetical protein
MNANQKFQKGTIGYAVEKLVKKYGNGTTGLTILDMAVRQAFQARALTYRIETGAYSSEDMHLTETPTWKAACAAEQEIFNRHQNEVQFANSMR